MMTCRRPDGVAIGRALLSFGVPVGFAVRVWDLANGGLAEIAAGGASAALRKVVATAAGVVVGGVVFGLADFYVSRWLRGDQG